MSNKLKQNPPVLLSAERLMTTNEISIEDRRVWVLEEGFDLDQSIAECGVVGLNQVVHVDVIPDKLFLDSIFRQHLHPGGNLLLEGHGVDVNFIAWLERGR